MAALLLQLAQFLVLWLLQGAAQSLALVGVLAVFGLLRVALSGLTGLVMIYALLSWVQARSPVSDLLDRLVAPLLSPIRRHMPLMGGVDLSPLALLLLLQVLIMLIGGLQSGMGYLGAANLPELRARARYVRVSPAGQKEAAPHDVIEVSTRTSNA